MTTSKFSYILLFFHLGTILSSELSLDDIVFVIISQEDSFHQNLALKLKESIVNQSLTFAKPARIFLSHKDLPHPGAWTILPLLPRLSSQHASNASWFVFLDNLTHLHSLPLIIQELSLYSTSLPIWLGHALYDQEPTIIHHFSLERFAYPNLASGIAMSSSLIQQLVKRLKSYNENADTFSVDASHELAIFIWNDGQGPKLTHNNKFCVQKEEHCLTYPEFPSCRPPVDNEKVYFAVKTCKKFHQARVASVVQRTWGQETKNIGFFSEWNDPSIPTIPLNIEITERGHCGKTFAIINFFNDLSEQNDNLQWLVIADDDTLLSVPRVLELLSCFRDEKHLVLGERYGYQIRGGGYNYVTGGGGIILGKEAVKMVAESCRCPTPATPDDMFLGSCLTRLGLLITHSPLFHQARPSDYADGYLRAQKPVSFHKHWQIDPVAVFYRWLRPINPSTRHSEL